MTVGVDSVRVRPASGGQPSTSGARRRPLLFDLTNLHELPPMRRKVYFLVSNSSWLDQVLGCACSGDFLFGQRFPDCTLVWGVVDSLSGLLLLFGACLS